MIKNSKILLVLLLVWILANGVCYGWNTNEFYEFGHWFNCHGSWKTCTEDSQWTSCHENYSFNSKNLILFILISV